MPLHEVQLIFNAKLCNGNTNYTLCTTKSVVYFKVLYWGSPEVTGQNY